MKGFLAPAAYGAVAALFGTLNSAHAIFVRGEYEQMWGAAGTFQFAMALAAFVGLLAATLFWLGSRIWHVSPSVAGSTLLGVCVAGVFYGSALLVPAELYRSIWLVPWVLLCLLSLLGPALRFSPNGR